MEEKIREIVRDELSKYFCAIQNNEEYESSLTIENESLMSELSAKTRECQLLREENKTLKARIEMYELTSPYNNDNKITKNIFNKAAAERGFNF